MTINEGRNYFTAAKRPRPSAPKLRARTELRAMAKPPPVPTTLDDALAQCVEANRAMRKELANSPGGRAGIRAHLAARRFETFINLLAIIDPVNEADEN
jgi:hypothetical protein